MIRRLFSISALLSTVIVFALSAAWLGASRAGAFEFGYVGDWHLWIADGSIVLARFGPDSDTDQPATAYCNVQWIILPLAVYGLAWGAFALVRSRRARRQARGFPVEPVQK